VQGRASETGDPVAIGFAHVVRNKPTSRTEKTLSAARRRKAWRRRATRPHPLRRDLARRAAIRHLMPSVVALPRQTSSRDR
jgi:hypothetical protein